MHRKKPPALGELVVGAVTDRVLGFLFRHKSRKNTAEPLVRHLLILGCNLVEKFAHERRIVICSRLLKPLAP
jgi:hypothetical protein